MDTLVYIIIIVVLILFSSFFSASETAFTCANRIRLKAKADEGSKAAKTALYVMDKYDKALTTILVGNNIVNIATSSLATVMFTILLADNGPLVSTVVITIVVLIFGEIMPKTIAKAHSEAFVLAIGGVMRFLMLILTPLSAIFLLLQKAATKLFASKNKDVSVTEQELMHIIDEIEDEGVLEEQESNLVRSALEFDETIVDEILTPRIKIVAVEINDDVEKLVKLFFDEGYSRIPVYEKNIDHIVGVVNHKEFLHKLMEKKDFIIRDIMTETIFVPSLMRISEILKKMQKEKMHMAVVVDQYGGTEGIVTLEDILEELVGEIWDENDEVVSPVKFTSENVFEVMGEVSLIDFNRYFENRNMEFEINSDCNTVGGWVVELFGKIPEPNDAVKTPDFIITVLTVNERTVGKMRFEIIKPEQDEEEQ